MASLLPQLFLDSGAGLTPSDGALLHFNVVGSGTDKNTYTTAAATVANSNPVVADAKGVFPPIYITGAYDWVLQNKNAVQQNTGTVDEFQTTGGAAVVKNFATLAAAVADTGLVDGDALNLAERTAGKGGGAMWDVVLSSAVTEDTYSIVQCTGAPTLSLVLRIDRVMVPEMLGAFADNSTIVTTALQAYADFCIANNLQFTWGYPVVGTAGFYKIDSKINFSHPCSITSISKDKGKLACDGCSGLDFTGSGATPSNMTIEKTYIAATVRHTDTPNSYFAVKLTGSTSSRPFWNGFRDCFFDGFGIQMSWEWVWSTRLNNVTTAFGGTSLKVVGKSVNNTIQYNSLSGDGLILDLTDGTQTKEGWLINNNLFDGFDTGSVIDFIGGGFCQFNDNICDFMGAVTAVLFRSSATVGCTGHDIKNNYIAFNAAGVTGIRMLGSLAIANENKGHTIDNNRIFPYPSGSLANGIVTDGTEEENNIISRNKIDAVSACNNGTAVNSVIRDNKWLNGGFNTTSVCEYYGNKGTISTSVALLIERIGNNTKYLNNVQPSTGTFVQGDEVKNIAPSIDGNDMALLGWARLTTGSGHVAGTDWSAMYVSNVTPAT